MKWLLTSTLSLVLVLGGCAASAINIANAKPLVKMDIKTMATKSQSKSPKLIFKHEITLAELENDSLHNTKLVKNSIRMKKMLAYLKTRVHRTPYVFSGDSLRYGWDCSGMVRWFYQEGFGITLEHSATAQAKVGYRIPKSKLHEGDIVIFGWKGYSSFYHASLYVGNNQVINANYGAGTTIIESLDDYKTSRIAYVRLVETLN